MILVLAAGIILLMASASSAQPSKIPLVGRVDAVTRADIDAAIAAPLLPQNIRFIRIVDHRTIQLHHESPGDRCLHFDDIRRKKGKWVYKTTVVVVEGCGYRHL